MRNLRIPFLCVLVSLAIPALPARVDAQGATNDGTTRVRARELFEDAMRLGEHGKFEEARKTMLAAYALHKYWQTAAYLGYVEMKTGHYREAAEHSAFAMRTANANASPEDRKDLADQFAAANVKVGSVVLRNLSTDASVLVDGRPRAAELEPDPVFLDPGPHQITVRRPSRSDVQRTVEAEAGKTTELDLADLPPLPAPSAASPTPVTDARAGFTLESSAPSRASARTWVGVAGGGLAAVAVGIGIGMTLRASSLNDDAHALSAELNAKGRGFCELPSAQCTELENRFHDRDTAATWAKVSFATGGVLGLATVAAVVFWPKAASAPRVGWPSWVGPGPLGAAGVTLGGSL